MAMTNGLITTMHRINYSSNSLIQISGKFINISNICHLLILMTPTQSSFIKCVYHFQLDFRIQILCDVSSASRIRQLCVHPTGVVNNLPFVKIPECLELISIYITPIFYKNKGQSRKLLDNTKSDH